MRVIKREIPNVNISLSAEPTFEVNRKNPQRPVNVNVTEGDDYSFICNPHAEPAAIITWYRNGEKLDGKLVSHKSTNVPMEQYIQYINQRFTYVMYYSLHALREDMGLRPFLLFVILGTCKTLNWG